MEDRYHTHARVFFEDGTIAYADYDDGTGTVRPVLFPSYEEAVSATPDTLRRRHDEGNDFGGGAIADMRIVRSGFGTTVVPLASAERVVVEANGQAGAHWWTALAARKGMVLATNQDGSDVHIRQEGLYAPHPLNADPDQFPVTGVPFPEVDFRDLDSENVRPDGLDGPSGP